MRTAAIALGCLLLLSALATDASTLELPTHVRHDRWAAESATPVPPGSLEAELRLDYSRTLERRRALFDNSWRKARASKSRVWDWDLTLTYGIMREAELSVTTGFVDIKDRTDPPRFDDKHARGVDDLDVGFKWRFHQDPAAGLSLAYAPVLTAPVGEDVSRDSIGPGQKFWGFTNRLAMTLDYDAFTANLDAGYMLPFGRNRYHYSRDFNWESRRTRGIADSNVSVGYMAHEHFIPEVGLSFVHEFRSRRNDSTAFDAVFGATIPITERFRAKAGVREPISGRNALRTRSLIFALAVEVF